MILAIFLRGLYDKVTISHHLFPRRTVFLQAGERTITDGGACPCTLICIPVTGEYTLVTMDEAFHIGPRDVSYTRPGCMHKSFVSSGNELLILYFGELFLNRFFTPESRILLLQDFRLTHFRIKTEVFPEVKALCLQLGDLAAKND